MAQFQLSRTLRQFNKPIDYSHYRRTATTSANAPENFMGRLGDIHRSQKNWDEAIATQYCHKSRKR